MDTKKTRLSHISNWIFLGTAIFGLCFLWCSYYSKNINLSLLTAIISTICFYIVCIPTYLAISKRKTKSNSKKLSIDIFKTTIAYTKCEKILEILKPILNFEYFRKVDSDHFILDGKKDLFFVFENLNTIKLSEIYRNRITNDIIIICNDQIKPEISLDFTNLTILTSLEIYNLLDKNISTELDKINIQKKPKYSLKDILCIVFCKSKSKTYFWLALILLFSSLFTPFSTYYIISSTVLFLISIFSRFNPFFNK